MIRDPVILTTPGTVIRLPSGNTVAVTGEHGEGVTCVYRRYSGDNKAAMAGVTLSLPFLERFGAVK